MYIYFSIYRLGFSKFAQIDPVSLEIKTKKHAASEDLKIDGNGFDSP